MASSLVVGMAAAGCEGPPPVPAPTMIFDPDPGHHFRAPTGMVRIAAIASRTVCFTTDGSTPEFANGRCTGGTTARLPGNNMIPLACGTSTQADTIVGVRLAFDWPGSEGNTVQSASGNFTLDCTQPDPDADGDGVPNGRDNCPMVSNPDQADANGNMVGDACEAMGAPDADMDGRPDAMDNCPRVWNVNQADDDRDGIGNVCDPTPRGPQPLPWNNRVLARAFVAWKDEVQCTLNGCRNPGGPGSWMAMCESGGTVEWTVSLSGLRAVSNFRYRACANTVTVPVHDYVRDPGNMDPMATRPMDIRLIVDGQFMQDTDFSGNGTESGMVSVTGDFTGTVVSHVQIRNSTRGAGSYFSVGCSMDPIEQEMCAPSNLLVNFHFPEWTCEPMACPPPPAPLRDRDGDGVFDDYDNCPDVANPTQANADFDMLGDACDSSTSMTDTDRDGIPDAGDNCPMVANPGQQDADRDGAGDACDSTPNGPPGSADGGMSGGDGGMSGTMDGGTPGSPRFSLLKVKLGRCLFDNGGDVRSTTSCDAAQRNQQWEVIDVGGGRRAFRNLSSMQCMIASSWAGAIGMAPCETGNAAHQWTLERYDQGGFDMQYPMRLHNVAHNFCVYTDGTADVYASLGNCGLLGTENNRKIGIYPNGDFSMLPAQP
jgi:hypothetical protein